MVSGIKEVLVLAPHTDDGELGAGATISKLKAEGARIHYVAFSTCEESLPNGLPKDTLSIEVKAATKELGVDTKNLHILDFKVRYFPRDRQEILEKLIELRSSISPDLVLLPSSTDVHQDHQVIHQEGVRAFKHINVLGYELPWNQFETNARVVSEVSEKNLQNKISGLCSV